MKSRSVLQEPTRCVEAALHATTRVQRIGCRGSPIWWQQENCCWDRDGNQVKCKLTELEDFRIDARDSHRHWVWDRTYPTVPEGFEQGIWAGAID